MIYSPPGENEVKVLSRVVQCHLAWNIPHVCYVHLLSIDQKVVLPFQAAAAVVAPKGPVALPKQVETDGPHTRVQHVLHQNIHACSMCVTIVLTRDRRLTVRYSQDNPWHAS
jgi:hypothetical protein